MKKTNIILSSVLTAAVLMSACSSAASSGETAASQNTPETSAATTAATSVLGAERAAETTTTDASADASTPFSGGAVEDAQAFFAEYADETVGQATGKDGELDKYSQFVIHEDGTFYFNNSESRTGDKDFYIYEATGTLGNLTKIDDHTYVFEVMDITPMHQPGEEYTTTTLPDTDGSSFSAEAIECDLIQKGDVLVLYTIGSDSSTLPSVFGAEYGLRGAGVPDEFPEWCLFNERSQLGFMSFRNKIAA